MGSSGIKAVPKPTEKSIKATTKAKMNEKYNKKTSKLRNKLKSHASAAAILARQNRALVKKIDKHTGASARKRAAAAALKKKNAMKAKLAKAKKAVESAQNPGAIALGMKKVHGLQKAYDKLYGKAKAAKKKAKGKAPDPIAKLTPFGRERVTKQRKKIKSEKLKVAAELDKMHKKMKTANKIISKQK